MSTGHQHHSKQSFEGGSQKQGSVSRVTGAVVRACQSLFGRGRPRTCSLTRDACTSAEKLAALHRGERL